MLPGGVILAVHPQICFAESRRVYSANAGAVLTSSAHCSTKDCNAYWDGTQMAYGDGNSSQGRLPGRGA